MGYSPAPKKKYTKLQAFWSFLVCVAFMLSAAYSLADWLRPVPNSHADHSFKIVGCIVTLTVVAAVLSVQLYIMFFTSDDDHPQK
jgi:hypothetical protein